MAMYVGGVQVTGTQTLDATKLTGNLPAISGASLTSLNGSEISSGTVAAARIADLAASKITSGTMDGARISGGTLGTTSGANLTSLPSPSTIPLVAPGNVSSYTFCRRAGGGIVTIGGTETGVIASGAHSYNANNHAGSTQSGTWKWHGSTGPSGADYHATLCQRIS